MRIRMAYFAKATVPKDLEKEANGVIKLAIKNSEVSRNHVTRPPTGLPNHANSNVSFSANAPINKRNYTEIKQDPDGIVTAKQRGSAGGNERRCKMSRTVESAKVGLSTPSRTAYQFIYDFLQTFEGFKAGNTSIKEFIETLLGTGEKFVQNLKLKSSMDNIQFDVMFETYKASIVQEWRTIETSIF